MKLLKYVFSGLFMILGPRIFMKSQSPELMIYKAKIAARKYAVMGFLALVSASLVTVGTILVIFDIASQLVLTQALTMTPLLLASLIILAVSVIGAVAIFIIKSSGVEKDENVTKHKKKGSQETANLQDAVALYVMDLVKERQMKREIRSQFSSSGLPPVYRNENVNSPAHFN